MMKNLIRKSVAVAIVAMGALMLSCGHDQQNEKKQTEALMMSMTMNVC